MDTGELFELAVRGTDPQSDRARARRQAMRAGLLREVDRRRSRRLVARAALGAVVLALAATLAWPSGDPATRTTPGPRRSTAIAVVRDDPGIADRLAAAPIPTSRIAIVRSAPIRPPVLLDDPQLVRWLDEAGHPSAVLRTEDQVVLSDPLTE